MSRWFPFTTRRSRARVRLLCLPHAGGNAVAFRDWSAHLPVDIEVIPIQLPGRGQRFSETPFESLDELLDALLPEVAPLCDRPVACFGHSMGATIGFEMIRRLAEDGKHCEMLFVAAASAPHRRAGLRTRHDLSDGELRRELGALGGTPPRVLEREDLMSLVLPTVRADLRVHERYTVPEGFSPLSGTVVIAGGKGDDEVPAEALTGWRELFTHSQGVRWFDGGHFFPLDAPEAICRWIADGLEEIA